MNDINIEIKEINNYDLLINWKDECLRLSEKHSEYRKTYDSKGKIITFVSIVLSSSVGFSSFLKKEEWITFFLGSMGILSAILQSLAKYLRYETMEYKHQNLSIKYKSLANEILLELTKKEKSNIEHYLPKIKTQMDKYLKDSPCGIV